ncbi:MAG: hypothetical protein ACT4PV_11250 [Planctomycetaceae bacterium]
MKSALRGILPAPLLALMFLASSARPAAAEDTAEDWKKKSEELEGRVRSLEDDRASRRALDEEESLGLGIVLTRGKVRGTLQIFGDAGAQWQNPANPDRGETSFFLGGVNIFGTAQVGDHFHVLSETVIKTREDASSDRVIFDQERLSAAWIFNDHLYVKLGLDHGPVSRWNHLFHHGRWLETTIDRPLLARFETSGGILPMHNTGIEVGGRHLAECGPINYVFILSNGRGRSAEDPQKISDRNDAKALELGIGFAPRVVEGLHVGVHVRYDELPADPSVAARMRPIVEIILGGHAQLRTGPWEFFLEFVLIENDDRTSGSTFSHTSGYLQAAYQVRERWTAYMRIDFRQMESGDPYFMTLGRDLDRWEIVVGVRHELTSNAALKLEVSFGEFEERATGGTVSEAWYTRFGIQVSWVF